MAATPNAVAISPTRTPYGRAATRREHLFFVGMSVALTVTVFGGFAPTYYLHFVIGSSNVLTPSLHWHGLAFSAWMVLLVTQASLAARRRIDIHRSLGIAGAFLGAFMIVIGGYVAITRARQGLLPLEFLAAPLAGVAIVFPLLFGAALHLRRRTDMHKRLVLLATLEVVTPALSRMPGMHSLGELSLFRESYFIPQHLFVDLFLLALIIYDLATLKRVHPATLWGGLFLVAWQPLRFMIGASESWHVFASWLTS
jgi:hypothetical protein